MGPMGDANPWAIAIVGALIVVACFVIVMKGDK